MDKSIAKGGGSFRIGSPYKIAGRTYTPQADPNYRTEGKASWYGGEFHGRRTANGERFDAHALSAAHPTLPLPSYVRVTNLENQRSLVVRLNDRGPYRSNRLIDVSVQAAKLLGFYDRGLAQVRVEYVSKATLEGSDDAKLAATLRTEDASVMQAPAAAAAVQTETSPVSVDERVSTLAQCNRQGISGAYPKPVSDREDANCKPVLPETRTAALWPATTLTKKSYCVASLTLNQL